MDKYATTRRKRKEDTHAKAEYGGRRYPALTIDTIRNGPETLSSFDEILFTKLVERIVVDTQSTIRFQLYGGFEFQETLEA